MCALLDVDVWLARFDDAHPFSECLRQACSKLDHAFWPDDISRRNDERVDFSRIQGHKQITDLYLLALAVKNGGRLVTFDRAIALASVHDATARHLHLL